MKQTTTRLDSGFTLVEMLVVIGIIGILAATLTTSFSHLKTVARQSQAQNLVSELATAFTIYLQKEREWPDEWTGENGKGTKSEMDEEVCWVFQDLRLFDVTTYKLNSDNSVKERTASNINKQSLDRFGLLDPWGRAALRKSATMSATDKIGGQGTYEDHRLQFRLDTNYDGWVDSSDKVAPPPGVKVRASAIVWSRGPDGRDAFEKSGARYPDDDRLSWPYGQTRSDSK